MVNEIKIKIKIENLEHNEREKKLNFGNTNKMQSKKYKTNFT